LEYDGQTYNAYHKVEVVQNGKTLTELNKRERGAATNIGQNFKITLIVTKEKKGAEETHEIQLKLPYSLDGIVINIPGYLEGLPQEAWMSEFIPVATQEEQKEEAPTSDEFGLDDIGDF